VKDEDQYRSFCCGSGEFSRGRGAQENTGEARRDWGFWLAPSGVLSDGFICDNRVMYC